MDSASVDLNSREFHVIRARRAVWLYICGYFARRHLLELCRQQASPAEAVAARGGSKSILPISMSYRYFDPQNIGDINIFLQSP